MTLSVSFRRAAGQPRTHHVVPHPARRAGAQKAGHPLHDHRDACHEGACVSLAEELYLYCYPLIREQFRSSLAKLMPPCAPFQVAMLDCP